MASDPKEQADSRIRLIKTVQTPIGFFVLVVLVGEALCGAFAGISQGQERVNILWGMGVVLTLLIIVVTLLAFFRIEALRGDPPPAKSPDQQLAAFLADPKCRESLLSLFRTCIRDYVGQRGGKKRTAKQIEEGFGLPEGTIVKIVKLCMLIKADLQDP
jgi:hypothetical protein